MTAKGPTVTQSLQEYGRGIAGGLLFSLPLLYTMEVWSSGFLTHPSRLLFGLLCTLVLLLGYNYHAGLHDDATPAEIVIDSFEELGLGLLLSAFILWLLGRVRPGMAPVEIGGQIIIEAMTVAIGVSVGTAQLGAQSEDDPRGGKSRDQKQDHPHFFGQLVMAVCGAVLIAANIAPTEEVVRIAVESSGGKLLLIAILSMVLGGTILFFSDFTGSQQLTGDGQLFDVIRGTIVTYAVALLVSAGLLWFFGRFDDTGLGVCVSETVVLAFPALLGTSAGRLLLRGGIRKSS